MIRNDMFDICACFHKLSLYDLAMTELLKTAKPIGSVTDLLSFIDKKLYSKKDLQRIFIHIEDYIKLQKAEFSFKHPNYHIVPHDCHRARNEGILRIIANGTQIFVLIIVSRYAKENNIVLTEN
jgi:hypothetical protein